jgi:hypothetical protein
MGAIGMACNGAPLGGARGTGGNTGSGGDGPPCGLFYGCGSGTGGKVGTGGAVGTGGSLGAGGGVTSSDAGEICGQIAAKYQMALTVARACTPGAPNQCQVLVGKGPTNCPGSVCSDETWVNEGSLVESEQENWLNAGCAGPPQPCIEISCNPPAFACVGDGPGSATGTCLPVTASDGGSPDAGESCVELGTDYLNAVSAARACTPGASNQCQALADPVLEPCNADCRPLQPVNDATAASAALQRWAAQCADSCPKNVCTLPPTTGTCVVADGGGPGGICVVGTPATSADSGAADATSDASESCDQARADYQAALDAAQICTPGAPNQCQVPVNPLLTGCPPNGCDFGPWVNDATAVNDAIGRWVVECHPLVACPDDACLPSVSIGSCVAPDAGAATGRCVAIPRPTN